VKTRFSARAVRLLIATFVAVATFAFGAPASAAVPMCSHDGRSIAAPPIMRPKSGLVLESRGDCERLRALLTQSNHGEDGRGSPLQASDAPLRAVPAHGAIPTTPRLERLDVTDDAGEVRAAIVIDLFRPPRG
jgi:hypothetical protein